jgi:PhnB protein
MVGSSSEDLNSNPLMPHLVASDASAAIAFYEEILGAEVLACLRSPGGKVMNAELQIGASRFSLSDAMDPGPPCPRELGGSPVVLNLRVADVDDVFARALRAGAREVQGVEDAFWGDRHGQISDPAGHVWRLSTKVREMSLEEIRRAAAAWRLGNTPDAGRPE